MRMRLRAPDESESRYDSGNDNINELSASDSIQFLPPLDVGSPEYIEERLENLKRRPAWGDFLDQYVQDHLDSDSDSEAGDVDTELPVFTPGFVSSALWSLLVVATSPLLILCVPFLRHKGYGFWPLECHSIKQLFGRAVTNVIFMMFGLALLYWTICRELPDVFHANNALVKLVVQSDEMIHSANTCHAALLQYKRPVAQELCMPLFIDVVMRLVNACLLLNCHRRWARYLMVVMAVMFVGDIPTKLHDATFPAPMVNAIEPSYALVDEELLVALDGKNLKHGGSVAWVAYWGCAITANVDVCDKQFVSTFEAGNVAVTFKSLDHFIPCYRDPPNPLKPQEYHCFEHVRIRVKEKHSIPGWSRLASQISSEPSSLREESLDKLEISSIKHKQEFGHNRMNQVTIKPKNDMRSPTTCTKSIETVKIDISALSNEHLTRKNDEQLAQGKEAVEFLEKVDTGEMESMFWGSRDEKHHRDVSKAAEMAEKKLAKDEVTFDARFHANTEHDTEQSDDVTPVSEGLQQSCYTDEAELDKLQSQIKEMAAESAEERECTLKKELQNVGNERVRGMHDETVTGLSTESEVLDDEEKMLTFFPDN